MDTTNNTNVSLSNVFVQHPQAPLSFVENRLYHAALLRLHRKTSVADLSKVFYIPVKELFAKAGNSYNALKEAILQLKERLWFGFSLFKKLDYIKSEGVVECQFNEQLKNHLLHDDSYYTAIDYKALESAGLKNPTAFRLLWLLRSYYRPLSKEKVKFLTIAELESMLFDGNSPFAGQYRRLKQHIDSAVKALATVGVIFEANTDRRGLVAKRVKFTIPNLTLKRKSQSRRTAEAAVASAEQTVDVVVEVVKEGVLTTTAAGATTMVSNIAAKTIGSVESIQSIRCAGMVRTALAVDMRTAPVRLRNTTAHEPEPDHSKLSVPKYVHGTTLQQKLAKNKKTIRQYNVSEYQAHALCMHVWQHQHLASTFFSTLYRLYNEIERPESFLKKIINPSAHIVKELTNALNFRWNR